MKSVYKKSKSVVAAIISAAILTQTVSYCMISTASAAELTQGAPAPSATSVISHAMKQYHAAVDSGMDNAEAISTFSNALLSAGVNANDIDTYALTTFNENDYQKFHGVLTSAMGNLNASQVSSQELAQLLQTAMLSSNAQGLSWAGCGGFVAGIVLAVGAVVVGIVALTKTKSSSKIQSEYNNQIASENSSYSSNVAYYQNWKTTLPNRITNDQNAIANDNKDIAYNNGIIAGSDPSSPNYQANIDNASASIQADTNDIQNQTSDINQTKSIYDSFSSNPNALNDLLSSLKATHDSQIASLQTQEASAVANVPDNKKTAGTLGIVAGVSAVFGGILIAGGSGSCN